MTSGLPGPLRQFYRPEEVAEILGVSLATVYRRIKDGSIPSRDLGGLIRIPIEEFRRLFMGPRQAGP